ncbi:MAG: tetratricopeptide repeat protein, partial [Pseudomonadota bacterium]
KAGPYLASAEAAAAAGPITEREEMTIAAARAWVSGDLAGAAAASEAASARFPRDLTMLKIFQYLRFNEGDSPAMLRAAQRALAADPANAETAYLHGMLAFAYEQCHLLTEAEESARRALALKEKEPWAQHALAHVMLTEGRIDEGAAFLHGVKASWTDLNSFMDTHLWWHLALFELSRGRMAEVLSIYDEHVWGQDKDYSQDQVGAVALLARLEMAGADVSDRWEDLAPYLEKRTGDVVNPFLTLQYLYGLARAGRGHSADALMRSIDAAAAAEPSSGAHEDAYAEDGVWTGVARPAAHGLLAYARGEHGKAARALGRALPRMVEAGGSHAQRDLFQLIHEDALVKSGDLVAAQQLLEQRRRAAPGDVAVNATLKDVYKGLGLEPA